MVSALDYTRLLPSVQYVKNRSCSATITITIDHEGHQRTNPNAPLGTPRSPGGIKGRIPMPHLGLQNYLPNPLCALVLGTAPCRNSSLLLRRMS